jgi:hypothetical protein
MRIIAEPTDAVDRADILAFRGMKLLQPARQLILVVRRQRTSVVEAIDCKPLADVVQRRRAALMPGSTGDLFAAEQEISKLVTDQPNTFRKMISVFRSVDIIVPVETDSLIGIHNAIDQITTGGGVLYTSTYIAASPEFNEKQFPKKEDQMCIGICTLPGGEAKTETRAKLLERGANVVDFVFGDFDLIALVTPMVSPKQSLLDILNGIDTISKSTTFLPLNYSPEKGKYPSRSA